MEALIIGISLLVILTVFGLVIAWLTHLSQNKNELGNARIWVTFRQFRKIFDAHKGEYTYDKNHGNSSLFGPEEEPDYHYMHAGIVKVANNIFYFRTPLNYILYEIYKNRYIDDVFKKKDKIIRLKNYRGDL